MNINVIFFEKDNLKVFEHLVGGTKSPLRDLFCFREGRPFPKNSMREKGNKVN